MWSGAGAFVGVYGLHRYLHGRKAGKANATTATATSTSPSVDAFSDSKIKSLSSSSSSSVTLQILLINDVYEIDNFPNFASCRKLESMNGANKTISLMAGDFVAPSLLSSIDKGAGMVDCMNESGIDYCCIGNHESDVDFHQLNLRMKQSKFTWINSNMQSIPLEPDVPKLPEYSIVEVKSKDGSHTRRIGLIGLCGEDRSVMKPGAFGGCDIEPLRPKAKALYERLMSDPDLKLDTIVPMTHQLMWMDRDLANDGVGFPIILGGHDHDKFLEEINGCTIVKSGCDAKDVAICNLTWESAASTKPKVSVVMKKSSEYPASPEITKIVDSHKSVLVELEKSILCPIPSNIEFSSIGMRLRPTTVGFFVCHFVKAALKVDCVMIGAGSIRGNRDYKGVSTFTYANLKSEIPFDTVIVTVDLPGKVICDMISYTRAFALQSPPVEKGGYIQTNRSVLWDKATNTVTHIAGAPVDHSKLYRCALNIGMLEGLDNVAPLLEYKRSCGPADININKTAESGCGAKEIIVSYFSKQLLVNIFKENGGFDNVDKDGNNKVTKEELREAMENTAKFHKKTGVSTSVIINNLFAIADTDNSGFIDKMEMLTLTMSIETDRFFQTQLLDCEKLYSLKALKEKAAEVLGAQTDFEAIFGRLQAMIDENGNGHVSEVEYLEFMTKLSAVEAKKSSI